MHSPIFIGWAWHADPSEIRDSHNYYYVQIYARDYRCLIMRITSGYCGGCSLRRHFRIANVQELLLVFHSLAYTSQNTFAIVDRDAYIPLYYTIYANGARRIVVAR